jgi:type VI secretion system secreted protein VgrG
MVVGKSGEEIWTDKYGRIKVQFLWDREGKKDENSSCWIRVAHPWAGKTWGIVHLPRIGQEVLVEFLEGDPDRPIVTGCVYNADQMPPFALPDNQTQSGMRSRTTKSGNNKTFNELRFEDKKDEEEIYFHAEKDFKRIVENDDVLEVGHEKKDKGDQTIKIFNNQTLEIGDAATSDGSQKITIKTDRTTSINEGNDALTIKAGNQTITIGKDQSVDVKGKSTQKANQSIELKVGASSIKMTPDSITLKSVTINVQGNAQVNVKGAMGTVDGGGMLTLKGGLVKIN